jgi:hypothetical protein
MKSSIKITVTSNNNRAGTWTFKPATTSEGTPRKGWVHIVENDGYVRVCTTVHAMAKLNELRTYPNEESRS